MNIGVRLINSHRNIVFFDCQNDCLQCVLRFKCRSNKEPVFSWLEWYKPNMLNGVVSPNLIVQDMLQFNEEWYQKYCPNHPPQCGVDYNDERNRLLSRVGW